MNKIQISSNVLRIITGVVLTFLGLILLIKPEISLVTACYISGALTAIKGISKIIESKRGHNTGGIVSGILFLVLALVIFLFPLSVFSFLSEIIGLAILIPGIISLLSHKSKGGTSKLTSTIMIIGGILIIALSFKFAKTITAVSGLAIAFIGIRVIIRGFIARKQNDPKYESENAPETSDDMYKEINYNPTDYTPTDYRTTDEEYIEVEFTDVDDE